jgi:hypothetical protein
MILYPSVSPYGVTCPALSLQRVVVCTNTRVLPLHTAYASHASARDHVIWNARTVTARSLYPYISVLN